MAKKNIPYDQKYYDPEIECMPRPELEQLQLERLQTMVQYAYDNTVYYKRSFDAAGVKPSDIKTLDDLAKFPFINKQTERETQHVGSFFGELCSVPEEDVVFMATSSGSTGVPTVSPFTQEDFDLWQDTEARLFWQAGMRPNDRYVHGLNFALYVGGPDVIGAQRLGALAIWAGAIPSDRLIFVLKQYQPTIIWTSPSYAWTLGQKIKEKGLDPRNDFSIRTIIVAGEPGGSIESTRESIEELWGECGRLLRPVATSTMPARPCARRRTACTSLRTRSSWRPGRLGHGRGARARQHRRADLHHAHEEGPPDDPLPHRRHRLRFHREVQLRPHPRPYPRGIGRKDEMFIVGAVNVFPSDVEYVVRKEPGLTGEYSIRVYDENFTTRYEVSVERAFGSDEPYDQVSKRVEAALKAHTGVRPAKVIVFDADKLGTSSEHKAKRFIDERDSAK